MNSIVILLLLTFNHLWYHCFAGTRTEHPYEASMVNQKLNQSQQLLTEPFQRFRSRFADAFSSIAKALKIRENKDGKTRYVEPTEEQLAEYYKLVKEYKEANKKLDIECGYLHDKYYGELERTRYQRTDSERTKTLWIDYINCREQYEEEIDTAAEKMENHFIHPLVKRGFYESEESTSSSTDSSSSETY